MSKQKQRNDQPTYYLLTLGCPKNTVDSEGMAMLLQGDGYRASADPAAADLLVVNTCGFLDAAKEESIAALRDLARGKRRHQRLIAAGCLAQRNGDEIVRGCPASMLYSAPAAGWRSCRSSNSSAQAAGASAIRFWATLSTRAMARSSVRTCPPAART